LTRHLVYPGFIISRQDGDKHYIGFLQLCRLYRIDPHTAIDVRTQVVSILPQPDDKHYHPRYDGKYPLFEESVNE
jgi:hypothetical protein